MIRLSGVRKEYATRQGPVVAMPDTDLEVTRGMFLVLRGASGSGKTTLLLTVGGMLHPTAGTVSVDRQDVYHLNGRDRARFRGRTIGFVFQTFHLVAYLTVLENILLPAGGLGLAPDRDRAQSLLEDLGLNHRRRHTPSQLSAGERQRVALARALYHEPKVILADEPTGNLDPDNAGHVFEHLSAFHKKGGTVLLVTHGEGADAYADKVSRFPL